MTLFPNIWLQSRVRHLLSLQIFLCLISSSALFASGNESARQILKRATQQMRSSPDSSLMLLHQLWQDPVNTSDPTLMAEIDLELGNAYLIKGKMDSAEIFIQRSLDFFSSSDEKLKMVRAIPTAHSITLTPCVLLKRYWRSKECPNKAPSSKPNTKTSRAHLRLNICANKRSSLPTTLKKLKESVRY